MRRPTAAILLAILAALLVAGLGAGAWEIHRLDTSVARLRSEERREAQTQATSLLKHDLAALARQSSKLRDSGLRLEFRLPLNAYLTRVAVGVDSGALSCEIEKRRWQNYMNDKLIPYVNTKPALKRALRRDDPDFHATLLNAFPVSC